MDFYAFLNESETIILILIKKNGMIISLIKLKLKYLL